jgi:hypothetical protein
MLASGRHASDKTQRCRVSMEKKSLQSYKVHASYKTQSCRVSLRVTRHNVANPCHGCKASLMEAWQSFLPSITGRKHLFLAKGVRRALSERNADSMTMTRGGGGGGGGEEEEEEDERRRRRTAASFINNTLALRLWYCDTVAKGAS